MTATQPKIRIGSREWWAQREREQIRWIEQCGNDQAGYIANYGDPGCSRADGRPMAGEGGTAIFKADMAELHRIQKRLEEKGGTPTRIG